MAYVNINENMAWHGYNNAKHVAKAGHATQLWLKSFGCVLLAP